MSIGKWIRIGLGGVIFATGAAVAQDYEKIDRAFIYDHDPSTKVGDDIYGTIICDFEKDSPGRNSHGGPVCMEYANGEIVAFHSNAKRHSLDGWSEFALSKDGGKTWDTNNIFPYSYAAHHINTQRPAWVEEGLVTQDGTAVLFITHFERGLGRSKSGFMRSFDHGSSWTDYEPVDRSRGDGVYQFAAYPAAVAVDGGANYVLFDADADTPGGPGPHVLYASRDNGRSWRKISVLPLDDDLWYGALCVMRDGSLLAGAYDSQDEDHFYYCISQDKGRSWSEQKRAYVDKKIRDPEVAYIAGRYYLHGRAGHHGEGSHRFVLYQSPDGKTWGPGMIISGRAKGPDGYSHNCIINKYDDDVPNELMVVYSILYGNRSTNEYVFFIKPETEIAQ